MNEFGKKVLYGLVAFAVIVGFKFFNKSSNHEAIKKQLLTLCADDGSCEAVVKRKFDACFESHYRIKRRSSGLNQEAFLACFNMQRGGPFFAIQTKE